MTLVELVVLWTLTLFIEGKEKEVPGYQSQAACEASAKDLRRQCNKPKDSTFNLCWEYPYVCLPARGTP